MLPTPGTPANVIAFHPYNPKIVVAGNNHIKMWDIEQGMKDVRLPHEEHKKGPF